MSGASWAFSSTYPYYAGEGDNTKTIFYNQMKRIGNDYSTNGNALREVSYISDIDDVNAIDLGGTGDHIQISKTMDTDNINADGNVSSTGTIYTDTLDDMSGEGLSIPAEIINVVSLNGIVADEIKYLDGLDQYLGHEQSPSWADVNSTSYSLENIGDDTTALYLIGLQDLTISEVNQLENIGTTTISATQWGYLGGTDQALDSNANVSFADMTISGNLYVEGKETYVDSEIVQVADNIVVLNYGEPGAGATNRYNGMEIERGTLTNYQFVYDETSDVFKVGEIGALQVCLTREDTPQDGGVMFYNGTTYRAETDTDLTYDADTGTLSTSIITFSSSINTITADEFKYLDGLNQYMTTTSSPTFVGMTLSSDLITTSTIDGVDIAGFKSDYDAKINQALLTTSSPSFVGMTITGNLLANDILERTPGHGVEIDGVLVKDGGMTFTGTINTITTDEFKYLDGLNQYLTTTSSPTFAGLSITGNLLANDILERTPGHGVEIDSVLIKNGGMTLSSNLITTSTIDGVDLASFKSDYDTKINQALLTTSSPTFVGMTLSSGTLNFENLGVSNITEYKEDEGVNIEGVNITDGIMNFGTFSGTAVGGIINILAGSADRQVIKFNEFTGSQTYSISTDYSSTGVNNFLYIEDFNNNTSIAFNAGGNSCIGGSNPPVSGDFTHKLKVNGTIGATGALSVDTISEYTATNGINIEGIHCEDGSLTFTTSINTITTDEFKYLDGLNQYMTTTSSPTFVGMTLSSDLITTSTIDGVDLASFKTDYDNKINQALLTTSSPTFASLTFTGTINTITAGEFAYLDNLNQYLNKDADVQFDRIETRENSSSFTNHDYDEYNTSLCTYGNYGGAYNGTRSGLLIQAGFNNYGNVKLLNMGCSRSNLYFTERFKVMDNGNVYISYGSANSTGSNVFTIVEGDITFTGDINTITPTEFAYLDGLNQYMTSSSSPTFAGLSITGNLLANDILERTSGHGVEIDSVLIKDGAVIPSASGQFLNMVYTNSVTGLTSSSAGNFSNIVYTPVSSSSVIEVYCDFNYEFNGYGADEFYVILYEYNGITNVVKARRDDIFRNNTGGGGRGRGLAPISVILTNSATTARTFFIYFQRSSGDDEITTSDEYYKITEYKA